MGTYVKNGNSCIGCSCLDGFPDYCIDCNNLKSKVELIKTSSSLEGDLKKALKLSQEYYHNSLEEIKELRKVVTLIKNWVVDDEETLKLSDKERMKTVYILAVLALKESE